MMMMMVEGTAGRRGRSMRGRRSNTVMEGADIGLSRPSPTRPPQTQSLVMRCLVISNPSSNYCFILSVIKLVFSFCLVYMYVHVVLLNGKCQVIFMSSYAFFFLLNVVNDFD
jgi:hypothetical protein